MTAVSSLTIEQLQQENERLLAVIEQRYSTIETLRHWQEKLQGWLLHSQKNYAYPHGCPIKNMTSFRA